jgi:hypothetical protein
VTLHDVPAELRPIKIGGRRRSRIHLLEGMHETVGHNQVSVPLVIGRHDKPWGGLGTGGGKCLLEGLVVLLPEAPLGEVLRADFPALVRILNTREQAFLLLCLADVEEELEDAGTAVSEQLLERSDLLEAALRLLVCELPVNPRDQDVFIMRSVEDADVAMGRT